MIFSPAIARKIVEGRVRQTRQRMTSPKPPYVIGRSYAIQVGGKTRDARVIVKDRREERLGDISFKDALASGFKTREAFFEDWGDLDERVWVVTFELDTSDTPRYLAPIGAGRYDPKRDRPGALEGPDDHGYTLDANRAVPKEPEPVPADVAERFVRESRERYAVLNTKPSAEKRLIEVLAEARLYGVDTTRQELSIEKRIAALERKVAAKRAA